MKIGVNAGHGPNVGARANGYEEERLNKMMNLMFMALGGIRGHTMIDATGQRKDDYIEGAEICNANNVDVAVSSHFNIGVGPGVEVFYRAPKSGDTEEMLRRIDDTRAMAHAVSQAIATTYGLYDRGEKPTGKLGFLNLATTRAPAILIEWGFLDAPGNTDVPKIIANPTSGVLAVLQVLERHFNSPGVNPYPKPRSKQQKGSQGSEVSWLQRFLNSLKRYLRLSEDGSFGPVTQGVVLRYQSDNRLEPDGIAGPLTLAKMGVTGTICPYAEPSVSLKKGSQGEGVSWIQWQLNRRMKAGLVVDGGFGNLTDTAVRNFQRLNNGLAVDGIVGSMTRARLKEETSIRIV